MRLKELYNYGKDKISEAGFPEPFIETLSLLKNSLEIETYKVYSHPELEIDMEKVKIFKSFIDRRIVGEPTAYITGKKEFYCREFNVSSDVIIPRPETELLVDEVLKLIDSDDKFNILDLGTGSGCIAVSIACERQNVKIFATDISFNSLLVAKENIDANKVKQSVYLLNSSILECFNNGSIDVIVSNPPYVSEKELKELDDQVKRFEPHLALYGGENGLEIIRQILNSSTSVLKDGGWCLLEVGYSQSEIVEKLFKDIGFINIETISDLSGIGRIVKGQWKK